MSVGMRCSYADVAAMEGGNAFVIFDFVTIPDHGRRVSGTAQEAQMQRYAGSELRYAGELAGQRIYEVVAA